MTWTPCPRCGTHNYFSLISAPSYICTNCSFGRTVWEEHGREGSIEYQRALIKAGGKILEEREIQKLIEGV